MALYIIIGVVVLFVGYIGFSVFSMKKRMANYDPKNESKKIHNLTDKNFTQAVSKGVVLVDFWANWCQPCRIQSPIISELADECQENVKICKLDIETNKKIAQKLQVRSIPTIIIFKNGKEVERLIGIKTKNVLKKNINKNLQ